jgi:large subunit ribosomal protein L30
MKQVRITQIKSQIGASTRQQRNLEALGLRGIRDSRVISSRPEIMGMVQKVAHLLEIEELEVANVEKEVKSP